MANQKHVQMRVFIREKTDWDDFFQQSESNVTALKVSKADLAPDTVNPETGKYISKITQ